MRRWIVGAVLIGGCDAPTTPSTEPAKSVREEGKSSQAGEGKADSTSDRTAAEGQVGSKAVEGRSGGTPEGKGEGKSDSKAAEVKAEPKAEPKAEGAKPVAGAVPSKAPVIVVGTAEYLDDQHVPVAPRQDHMAVYTGTHMLVWGGDTAQESEANDYAPVPPEPRDDGYAFETSTGTWSPLPTATIPGRYSAHVVWTGKEMLVWGGRGGGRSKDRPLADGGAYEPAASRWRVLASDGAPSARHRAATAWTGTSWVVFGGEDAKGKPLGDGAIYEPTIDRWTALAGAGAPSPRAGAQAVWTGSEVLVWGGFAKDAWKGDGAAFNPSTGHWRALSPTGAPLARESVVAWSGEQMLVWGGYIEVADGPQTWISSGVAYDPKADTWSPMGMGGAKVLEAPRGLWAGSVLAVFCDINGDSDIDDCSAHSMNLYDPVRKTWSSFAKGYVNYGGSVVWTGSELIAWGGFDSTNLVSSGYRVSLRSK